MVDTVRDGCEQGRQRSVSVELYDGCIMWCYGTHKSSMSSTAHDDNKSLQILERHGIRPRKVR